MRAARCLRDQHPVPLVEIGEAPGARSRDERAAARIKLTDAGRELI